MSEKIMRAFEEQRTNPFQFKYVQLCHSLADLHSVPEPKVFIMFSVLVFCNTAITGTSD